MARRKRKHPPKIGQVRRFMMRITFQTYECPVCGEDVEIEDGAEEVDCWKCGTALLLDPDADFDGERFVDNSRLVEKSQVFGEIARRDDEESEHQAEAAERRMR